MERVVKYTITRLSLLDDMTYKAIDLLIFSLEVQVRFALNLVLCINIVW